MVDMVFVTSGCALRTLVGSLLLVVAAGAPPKPCSRLDPRQQGMLQRGNPATAAAAAGSRHHQDSRRQRRGLPITPSACRSAGRAEARDPQMQATGTWGNHGRPHTARLEACAAAVEAALLKCGRGLQVGLWGWFGTVLACLHVYSDEAGHLSWDMQ